jgi:thiamine-monophosphate kinase
MKLSSVGEFKILEFIASLTAKQKDRRMLLGPGDDCAVLRTSPGMAQVVTTDEMADGTHFLLNRCTAEQVARKLVRINLSDLAGMGAAKPVTALCGAGLPREMPYEWVKEFTAALMDELNSFGSTLCGGNLTRCDNVHVYLTVIGEGKPQQLVRRDGARPGDLIFGIGAFGEAKAGLDFVLKNKKPGKFAPLYKSFWLPKIQLEAGDIIGRKKLATAMMDNSDGLYKSVKTLAAASGCGAFMEIGEDALSPVLKEYCKSINADWREYVLSGGEDYGLVVAADPRKAINFIKHFPRACALGVMTKGKDILLHENCKPHNFEHF